MSGSYRGLLLSLLPITFLCAGVWGADESPRKLYGSGVHAFHQGDYEKAYALFSRAIDEGSDDPRCFYFRGITSRRLGRYGEAAIDFQTGVRREARIGYSVASSLERIQGRDRFVLESYRRQITDAKRLARQIRLQPRNQSPGDRLPEFESDKVVKRNTEVPPSSTLSALDPADPYTRPRSIFDEPINRTREAVVATEPIDDEAMTEASSRSTGAASDEGRPREEPDIFGFGDDAEATSSDGLLTTEEPDNGDDDVFNLDADDSEPGSEPPRAAGGGRSTLGSIFRALGRAAPKVDLSRIQQQIQANVPGVPGPGNAPPEFDSPPPEFGGPPEEIGVEDGEAFDFGPADQGNPFGDDPL